MMKNVNIDTNRIINIYRNLLIIRDSCKIIIMQ